MSFAASYSLRDGQPAAPRTAASSPVPAGLALHPYSHPLKRLSATNLAPPQQHHVSSAQAVPGQLSPTEDSVRNDHRDDPPVQDVPVIKKKRSRKGQGKRFQCTAEGCGKSYSRAEHLHRHQLNHNSMQTFRCQYPGCQRSFVRGDLLKRHVDRHAARGPQHSQSSSTVSNIAQSSVSEPASAESNFMGSLAKQTPRPLHSPQEQAAHSSCTPVSNTSPSDRRDETPSIHVNENHDGVCQAAHRAGYTLVSRNHGTASHSPGLSYPTENYSTEPSVATPRGPPTEMMALDHMAMSGAGPVFGDDGGMSKSPYVGMPEDFMAYLFNSLPGYASHAGNPASVAASNYGLLQSHQYSVPYVGAGSTSVGYLPVEPQRIMAVNNLLDQNGPEANLSEEKSEELFEFIRDRFHEHDIPQIQRQRDCIVTGDRSQSDHLLSRRMMQAYISSYWFHFSDQMPILHKPTFCSDQTPNLLLLAMMILGAACLDRTQGQQMMTGARLPDFLARHLRWEIFMDPNFRPPAKLWVFQALILLEVYEKMYSTRELHERAHIHHATTITLMRRGRSLIGKSSLDSPPMTGQIGSKHCSAMGATSQTADEWWNRWIAGEATRRAAFAAFVIDTTHATMFGHSGVMAAHELRLALPCDESLWRASSSAEVVRIESGLASQGIKPMSFLEGLRCTLGHQEVRTTSFGRAVLMAGLLSVTYHMHQRDLQVNILGSGVTHALGMRDQWRSTLTCAYDSWKADFDKALEQSGPSSDPYRHDAAKHEFNIVFASRTVLYHLAHMATYADVVDCQMFARAKRLLGRTVGPQEFNGVQHRIKEIWAHSARARDATFHALKFLNSVLLPGTDTEMSSQGQYPDRPYEARSDVLMNRPWVLYFAALIVWCYGYALEGPCAEVHRATSPYEVRNEMRNYLVKFGSMKKPSELEHVKGVNCNTALLTVLKESFENTRWELLHEAAYLLRNCIQLTAGEVIP
ncbi:hypothetical protein HIM_01292 [Hirsutella minnesotensis 3608]|nr:hypothetical protein HIM_01292 [Hirsutella minnesotensis 3608]